MFFPPKKPQPSIVVNPYPDMDLLPADIPLKEPEINPIPLNINAFQAGNGKPNPSLVISIGLYASRVLDILKGLVDFDGTTSSHLLISSDASVQRSLERVYVTAGSVHRGAFATNLNTANDFINSLNTIIHTSNWNGVTRLDVVLMVALDEPLAQMTSEIIQILQMKLHEFHPSITGIFGVHADGDANKPRIKPVEAALIRELFRLSKGQPQLLSPVTHIPNSDVISKELLGRIVLLNIGEGGVSEINAAMAALMFIHPAAGTPVQGTARLEQILNNLDIVDPVVRQTGEPVFSLVHPIVIQPECEKLLKSQLARMGDAILDGFMHNTDTLTEPGLHGNEVHPVLNWLIKESRSRERLNGFPHDLSVDRILTQYRNYLVNQINHNLNTFHYLGVIKNSAQKVMDRLDPIIRQDGLNSSGGRLIKQLTEDWFLTLQEVVREVNAWESSLEKDDAVRNHKVEEIAASTISAGLEQDAYTFLPEDGTELDRIYSRFEHTPVIQELKKSVNSRLGWKAHFEGRRSFKITLEFKSPNGDMLDFSAQNMQELYPAIVASLSSMVQFIPLNLLVDWIQNSEVELRSRLYESFADSSIPVDLNHLPSQSVPGYFIFTSNPAGTQRIQDTLTGLGNGNRPNVYEWNDQNRLGIIEMRNCVPLSAFHTPTVTEQYPAGFSRAIQEKNALEYETEIDEASRPSRYMPPDLVTTLYDMRLSRTVLRAYLAGVLVNKLEGSDRQWTIAEVGGFSHYGTWPAENNLGGLLDVYKEITTKEPYKQDMRLNPDLYPLLKNGQLEQYKNAINTACQAEVAKGNAAWKRIQSRLELMKPGHNSSIAQRWFYLMLEHESRVISQNI